MQTVDLGVRNVTNIIVAFSKWEDAKSIKNILVRNGFQVVAVCTSGAQALNNMEGLNGGIVVSGYRFEDMLFQELHEYMPEGFQMLLVASASRMGDVPVQDVVCLSMPLKVHDLITTLEMMCESQRQKRKKQRKAPAERSGQEQQLIQKAKALLMERNHMTESEAHRYIQKCSMDSGTNMVETAQMVISLNQI